jgi:hypothetical protein
MMRIVVVSQVISRDPDGFVRLMLIRDLKPDAP